MDDMKKPRKKLLENNFWFENGKFWNDYTLLVIDDIPLEWNKGGGQKPNSPADTLKSF